MKEILSLKNIFFQYDKERVALSDLSVSLYESEKVVVLGNNGAGKSTFFLCCNGILKPEKGKMTLYGKQMSGKTKDLMSLRETVGLVFQDPDNQIIAGTVEEEISFGPMNMDLSEEQVRKQVDMAVNAMQLDEYRNRAPHYLSGGEKKRVSIADVLAMNPKLLLFDEPEASLDPANIKIFENNLKMMEEKGIGLVIATHDVDFAWRWADRVLVFSDGKLIADAEPEKVFSDEKLLEKSGLIQPILFKIGKLYNIDPLPRKIEDIEKEISCNKEATA